MPTAQWVSQHRQLSSEASAEPGRMDVSRAEYQREWLNAPQDDTLREMTIMAGSQLGKTETELSLEAWFMAEDPCPMLVVLPTQADAENYSKERLAPMIELCEPLKGKITDPKGRDGDNTIYSKKFPGGRISLTASHSPAGLAARPIRVIFFDEVDRFPPSAGSEGDPVDIGAKRTSTFWDSVIVKISSPTIAGASRIETSYEEGTQEIFNVPCPHCGVCQRLVWGNVHWHYLVDDAGKKALDPDSVHYECEHCRQTFGEAAKTNAVSQGHWIAKYPGRRAHRSFHISALYSPWVTLVELVDEWLKAQDDTERLKTFVNTRLAETWAEHGEAVEELALFERREDYVAQREIPAGVAIITMAIDTQDDRLELEIKGWGRGRESWSLEYFSLQGDPSIIKGTAQAPTVWDDAAEVIAMRRYKHPFGHTLRIGSVVVDSGGHNTDAVYRFCVQPHPCKVMAIKGHWVQDAPIWPAKGSANNVHGCKVFMVGVNNAKNVIYSDLRRVEHGPGYCHHPDYHLDYFRGLTAEQRVTRKKRGHPYTCWVKKGGRSNEPFDLHVYNLGNLEGLHKDLDALADQMGLPRTNAERIAGVPTEITRPKKRTENRRYRGSKTWPTRR